MRDKRLRTEYPVAGRYITGFNTQTPGMGNRTGRGVTEFRQNALEIEGETEEQGGRHWCLYGNIKEEGGFVHGIYRAKDPRDPAMGVFFLRITVKGDLEGLWGGFESLASDTAWGEYRFTRCPPCETRPAMPSEAERVTALLGETLGDKALDPEKVRSAFDSATDDVACLVAITPEDKLLAGAVSDDRLLAGAMMVEVLDGGRLPERLREEHHDPASSQHIQRYNRRIGLLRSIAVRKELRGRGIGTELTRRGVHWCHEHGASAVLSFGRKAPAGAEGDEAAPSTSDIESFMAANSFRVVDRVNHAWSQDGSRNGNRCPDCGSDCECSAMLFSRTIMDLGAATEHVPSWRRWLRSGSAAAETGSPSVTGDG